MMKSYWIVFLLKRYIIKNWKKFIDGKTFSCNNVRVYIETLWQLSLLAFQEENDY